MYRIINPVLLYWFCKLKTLNSNNISQYNYYIQYGSQKLEHFVWKTKDKT